MFSDVLDREGGGARVYAEEKEIPSSPRRTLLPLPFRPNKMGPGS